MPQIQSYDEEQERLRRLRLKPNRFGWKDFFEMITSAGNTAAANALGGVIGAAILASLGWAVLNITELATIGAVAGAILSVPYYLYTRYRVNKVKEQLLQTLLDDAGAAAQMNSEGNPIKPKFAMEQEPPRTLSVEDQEKKMHADINQEMLKMVGLSLLSSVAGPLGASILGMTADIQIGYAAAAFGVYTGIGILCVLAFGFVAHHYVPQMVEFRRRAAEELSQQSDLRFTHNTNPQPREIEYRDLGMSNNANRASGKNVYLPQQEQRNGLRTNYR